MKVLIAKSLNQAVRASLRHSKDKDVVLFSPGCASKDWFKNFEDQVISLKILLSKCMKKLSL